MNGVKICVISMLVMIAIAPGVDNNQNQGSNGPAYKKVGTIQATGNTTEKPKYEKFNPKKSDPNSESEETKKFRGMIANLIDPERKNKVLAQNKNNKEQQQLYDKLVQQLMSEFDSDNEEEEETNKKVLI